MDNGKFEIMAKKAIRDFYNKKGIVLLLSDIYIVWSCKTLQNNKLLASTNNSDTRYFEITYNGNKNEVYFDAYIKEKNMCFSGDVYGED